MTITKKSTSGVALRRSSRRMSLPRSSSATRAQAMARSRARSKRSGFVRATAEWGTSSWGSSCRRARRRRTSVEPVPASVATSGETASESAASGVCSLSSGISARPGLRNAKPVPRPLLLRRGRECGGPRRSREPGGKFRSDCAGGDSGSRGRTFILSVFAADGHRRPGEFSGLVGKKTPCKNGGHADNKLVLVRHFCEVNRWLMLIFARYLLMIASLMSGMGDAMEICGGPSPVGHFSFAVFCSRPRAELMHAPAGSPANPRPLLAIFGEKGIDEEDNDEFGTSTAIAPADFGFTRPIAMVPSVSPSVDRVHQGRAPSAAVLRC